MDDKELEELIKNCLESPDNINNLSDEQIEKISKKITPYGTIAYVPEKEYTCFSITNLRESYIKRLIMVSVVGYMYRCVDEYNGCEDKSDIKKFLNSIFEFNPDYHSKKSSIKTKKEEIDSNNKENEEGGATTFSNKNMESIPADVFYRIDNYMSVNYEKLRDIVDNVFCEKQDFDYIINIYDSFDTPESAQKFTKKYQDQFIHEIFTIKNNNWTFLGPFKENRNKIDFYNENTDQLKAILEQVESDQKLGKELMKKRVTNEKRINIRNQGKHSKDIKAVMGNENTLADDIEANDLEKEDNPFVRVDVFENDGLDLRKSHFYTESEAPAPLNNKK